MQEISDVSTGTYSLVTQPLKIRLTFRGEVLGCCMAVSWWTRFSLHQTLLGDTFHMLLYVISQTSFTCQI